MRWALEQDCTTFVDGLFLFLLRDPRIILATFCDDEKTSNRIDDNVETLQKRFRQYEEETVPCVHKLKEENKLVEFNCDGDLDVIYKNAAEN
ncbi:hypothetical protein VTN96DRAFT_5355 [Rasamsonia emersonii]